MHPRQHPDRFDLHSQHVIQRFMRFVLLGHNHCWEWQGSTQGERKDPYGAFNFGGKMRAAHRIAYQIFNGKIPENLFVLHSCDNRACVSPAHLFLGTAADNVQDMLRKNRAVFPYGPKAGAAKLSEDDVRKIRQLKLLGHSHTKLAKMYGVGKSTVAAIHTGQNWTYLK